MNRLSVFLTFLMCASGAVDARPASALQSQDPPEDVNWRPYTKLPKPQAGEQVNGTSMTVDTDGIAHFVQIWQKPGSPQQGYHIKYFNTGYHSRSDAAGFSTVQDLDYADPALGESVGTPEVAVGLDGIVHVVWGHGYPGVNSHGYDVVKHCVINADGQASAPTSLTTATPDQFHDYIRAGVSDDGALHVIFILSDYTSPPTFRIQDLVYKSGGAQTVTVTGPTNGLSTPRIAVRKNLLCVVWTETTTFPSPRFFGTDIFYSLGTSSGGSASWGSKTRLTTTGYENYPDVDIEISGAPATGKPHIAWSQSLAGTPTPDPTIQYSNNGGPGIPVSGSQKSVLPNLYFGRGAQIKVSGNEVHVFYDGFSHTTSHIGKNDWKREEPIKAPNSKKLRDAAQVSPFPPCPSLPTKAAEFRGRFDIVDNLYYVRTYETMPDGASWVPAFPGGSVNIVPLSGSLKYRLELFGAKGVGPCTSLGMTYQSKHPVGSLLGPGWIMDHLMYITVPDDGENITLVLPNGLSINFTFDTNKGYALADNSFGFVGSIAKITAGWKLLTEDGMEYRFNQYGKLGTIFEPTGNYIDIAYNTDGTPSAITDMLGNGGIGRTTTFTYGTGTEARHIKLVTDPAGNQYQLNYAATAVGYQLSSVMFLGVPERPTYSFEYGTNGLMSRVTMPRGNAYSIFYDSAGRVDYIEDPPAPYYLDTESADFAPPNHNAQIKFTYNADDGATFGGKFHSKVKNRRGYDSIYVFDASNKFGVTEFWDATAIAGVAGIQATLRSFDIFGNVTSMQDRWGLTTTYTYKPPSIAAPWLTNLMTSVTKGGQPFEDFSYSDDQFGNVTSHTTYAGGQARTTTYDYDTWGRLTTTHYPNLTRPDGTPQNGVTSQSIYAGPRRQLSRTINEEGHYTDFSMYQAPHGLPQSIVREGGTDPEMTEYDVLGNIYRTKRPFGGAGNTAPGWTTFGRDGLYRVRTVTDPAGQVTTNSYDLDSHLISVLPPAGAATTTIYDARGSMRSGTTSDGSWFQGVDANGNIRRKSSLRGVTESEHFFTQMDYDSLDRVSEMRAPGATTIPGQGGGGPTMRTTLSYDGFVSTTQERFSLETQVGSPSRVTRTTYDLRQRPIRVQHPDSNTVVETFYNEQDQVIATQTKVNSVFQTATLTFLDARDRVERVRIQNAPYLGTPTLTSDRTTLFNKVGSVMKSVDPMSVSPAGFAHATTNVLDARERVVQVKDGFGNVVRELTWGDDDLLIESKIPDPATKSTTMVRSEIRTYTARKEPKTILNRSNVGTTYAYTEIEGQVDTVVDALGRTTKTTYDSTSRRVDEVITVYPSTNGRRTKTTWSEGLLKQVTVWDPVTQSYTAAYQYSYDQADRLERIAGPVVTPERLSYNEFGEESQVIAGTKTITRTYNALGQKTQSIWTGAFSQTELRTYNGIGQVQSVSSNTHQKDLSYDLWLGTPKVESFSVAGAFWKSQTYVFDVAGNNTFLTDSNGALHEWVYDENNRVRQIRYGAQGVCDISYTVGGLADRTTLRNAAGAVIAETTHTYDGLGRKTRLQTLQTSNAQVLADFEWTYNAGDLVDVLKVNHLGVQAVLTYNERRELIGEAWTGNGAGQTPPPNPTVLGPVGAGQPSAFSNTASASPRTATGITAVTKAYVFDPAGNRLSTTINSGTPTTYTYNAASQLTSESGPGQSVSHLYDEWGQEKSRTTTPTSGTAFTESYIYNYLNQLSDYQKTLGSVHWQYDFWPTGERYAKRNLNNAADNEFYISKTGDVVTEYSTPAALKNTYVQGTGIDSKYTRIAASGQRRHYIGDQVGTVGMTLTDAAAISETTVRDAWGLQISSIASAERYGYAQREHDQDSGLIHMRHRQYDPRVGRFTQTDPILGNRATKHYAYTGNNPIIRVDPLGLDDGEEAAINTLIARHLADAKYLDTVTNFWGEQTRLDQAREHRETARLYQMRLAGMVRLRRMQESEQFVHQGSAVVFNLGIGVAGAQVGMQASRAIAAYAQYLETVRAARAAEMAIQALRAENARRQMVPSVDTRAGVQPPVPPGQTWTAPPGWRGPKTGGTWSGARGDSTWTPSNPAKLGMKQGESVPFIKGRPDFSKWTKESFEVPGMTGEHETDMPLIHKEIARQKGWTYRGQPNAAAAERWLQQEGLTPHHNQGTNVQVVPKDLHGNVPHIGSAADMRNGTD